MTHFFVFLMPTLCQALIFRSKSCAILVDYAPCIPQYSKI
nr:MAG TPA: hypothetical protein [Caudoviricetes sp.]